MENLEIEDCLLKCRCCFRILIEGQTMIYITKQVEDRFLDLCEVPLVANAAYSNVICELCDRDLRNFHHLKKDLATKQKKLYELIPVASDEVLIKPQNSFEDSFIAELDETLPDKEEFEKIKARNRTECERCGVVMSSKVALKRHVERVHLKVRNFQCDSCSFASYFKHTLENHIVKHIPEEYRVKYLCDACDFISISAVNIQLHKKYQHGKSMQAYVCNVCSKAFARPGQLKAHIRLTHEKRKDKICNHCQRSFSTTTRLKEHVRSLHTADSAAREFSCEFCSKQFMTLNSLKNHLVYHKEPSFPCQMGCDKRFHKPGLLDYHHKTTHLAQKDFACSYPECDHKYFLRAHLERHIRSFHNKIKLNCEFCEAKFVRKETYRAHITSHHQDIKKPQLDAVLNKIKTLKLWRPERS